MVLCVLSGILEKQIFALKMGKMGQKYGFLNLLKNLVINFFLNVVYKEKFILSAVFLHKSRTLEKSGS